MDSSLYPFFALALTTLMFYAMAYLRYIQARKNGQQATIPPRWIAYICILIIVGVFIASALF